MRLADNDKKVQYPRVDSYSRAQVKPFGAKQRQQVQAIGTSVLRFQRRDKIVSSKKDEDVVLISGFEMISR